MLDEIKALIVLAEVGSLQKAAERLFLTPSAVTRQIQRLEARLGASVLDRRSKPPVITPIGRSVVDRGRDLLGSFQELMASATNRSEPNGPFRLGIAHGLAVPTLAGPIRRMTDRFPNVRPNLSADMTQNLLESVRHGHLDAALTLLPTSQLRSFDLIGETVVEDGMAVTGPRRMLDTLGKDPSTLDGRRWVLNPPGCLVREKLRLDLEANDIDLDVAAEVHNIELQLSLVEAGYGIGLFTQSFIGLRIGSRRDQDVIWSNAFSMPVSVTFVRAGSMGALEPAAIFLLEELRRFFTDHGSIS